MKVSFPDDPKEQGSEYCLSEIVAEECATIRNMVTDLGDSEEPIPLPQVKRNIFVLLENWYISGSFQRRVAPSNSEWVDLVLLANFLDARKLLDRLVEELFVDIQQWRPRYGKYAGRSTEIDRIRDAHGFLREIPLPLFMKNPSSSSSH